MPGKNKTAAAFKKAGPGQRKKIMEDPLYGKGSGSGTISQSKGFNFTSLLNERLKKKAQSLMKMKKGGSLNQHD